MAKKSKIVKNNKRQETSDFYLVKRKELLSVIRDPESSYDEKREAQKKIAKMPRDASATRHRNRCQVTGRPRGNLRKFGMSRNCLLYTSPSPRDIRRSRMPSSA